MLELDHNPQRVANTSVIFTYGHGLDQGRMQLRRYLYGLSLDRA